MKEPFISILPELWEEIYLFLDNSDCSNFERVCLSFRELCLRMERRKIREHIELEAKYLENPLFDLERKIRDGSSDQGVKEEEIQLVEKRMGMKFPFHLREFIKIVDGRPCYSQNLANLHYSNALGSFKSWTMSSFGHYVMIGGVFDDFEPTEILIHLGSGKMSMNISTYGTTDGIYGGFKTFMKMTSNYYESFNPYNMEKLSENFTDLVKISNYNIDIISYLPDRFKKDLDFMRKLLMNNPMTLKHMPDSIRGDINLVRNLILRNPSVYFSISEQLFKDKELFDLAFSLDAYNFNFVHDSLKTKENALKYCKSVTYPVYNSIPTSIIDAEIVYQFKYFCYVPEEFRTPELTKHFIENNYDFRYEIQNDCRLQTPLVLETIFRVCPSYLFNLKKEQDFVFDTKEVALKLFDKYQNSARKAFSMLPLHLEQDLDIIKAALKRDFEIFELLSEEMKQDRDFMLSCWKESVSMKYILNSSFPYCNDLEFLNIACNKNPELVYSVDSSLVSEEFLNSLEYYAYRGACISDMLKMTRFEHYKHFTQHVSSNDD